MVEIRRIFYFSLFLGFVVSVIVAFLREDNQPAILASVGFGAGGAGLITIDRLKFFGEEGGLLKMWYALLWVSFLVSLLCAIGLEKQASTTSAFVAAGSGVFLAVTVGVNYFVAEPSKEELEKTFFRISQKSNPEKTVVSNKDWKRNGRYGINVRRLTRNTLLQDWLMGKTLVQAQKVVMKELNPVAYQGIEMDVKDYCKKNPRNPTAEDFYDSTYIPDKAKREKARYRNAKKNKRRKPDVDIYLDKHCNRRR